MNLSSNILQGLVKTTDKATPGPRDSNIEVLPMLVPVHTPLLPLRVLQASNEINQESFITEYSLDKVALDPAGSDPLCVLGTGLWSISLFTYGAVIGTAGTYVSSRWYISLNMQGFVIPLVAQSSYSAALAFQTSNREVRFLFRDSATLAINWKAVAAGEAAKCQLSLVATRHL